MLQEQVIQIILDHKGNIVLYIFEAHDDLSLALKHLTIFSILNFESQVTEKVKFLTWGTFKF